MFPCQQPPVSMLASKNMKLEVIKSETHKTPNPRNIWKLGNSLCHFISFCSNSISKNFHFQSSFDTRMSASDLFIDVLSRRWIPIFRKPSSSDFGITLGIFWKPSFFENPSSRHIFIFLHQILNFFNVSGNRSGASSCCELINHRWVFHLRIRLVVKKILGSNVLYFGICCILINVRMNEDKRKFVLVKENFRWTHLFLN